MTKVLVLVINTGFGMQQELYSENVAMEEKGNFIRIKDKATNDILGFYPTEKIIGGRFFSPEEIASMVQKQAQPGHSNGNEAVHPEHRSEEQ